MIFHMEYRIRHQREERRELKTQGRRRLLVDEDVLNARSEGTADMNSN